MFGGDSTRDVQKNRAAAGAGRASGHQRRIDARWLLLPLVALTVLAAAGCQPPPDNFYTDPTELTGQPGTVLRSVEIDRSANPFPSINARHDVVLYESSAVDGSPVAVSGTILVPDAPWTGDDPRPVVALGPGTRGAGDKCAQSKSMARNAGSYSALVNRLLGKGYVVATTDYHGLGTPGVHLYMVADAGAYAMLDMARAAINFPGTGLEPTSPVGLYGYSQGGQASARASELSATYAPELNIVGAVMGGQAIDQIAVTDVLNGGPFFGFLAMASIGMDAAYPELDLASYLNEDGQGLLERNSESCIIDGALPTAFGRIEQYTTTNPLDEPAWQARLDQQSLGRIRPAHPVLIGHAVLDEVIPFNQSVQLRDRWCELGATVSWRQWLAAEHVIGGSLLSQEGEPFLTARFEGQPVADSACSSK